MERGNVHGEDNSRKKYRDFSGSPVAGLRASTAGAQAPSLAGDIPDCMTHAAWQKKKKVHMTMLVL